jgi:hypothetical protein
MGFRRRYPAKRHARSSEVANERRRAWRNPAAIHDVVLGWEKDGSRDELPAFLEDVSIEGCRASSRQLPTARPGEPIWFGLAGSHPAERIKGILVDARKPFLRKCSIRIKFLTPLPYATFKYLVYGPQAGHPKKPELREYETDQFWK